MAKKGFAITEKLLESINHKFDNYLHLSHMQLCFPKVSQYGTHRPPLHCPFSKHGVSSGIGADFGQSADVPVQRLSCSHVCNCASLHLSPAAMY